jgi:hypothetical protein
VLSLWLSRACLGKKIAFIVSRPARYQGSSIAQKEEAVRKRHFLSHLYIKINILPRQARDKHRESTQKKVPFSLRLRLPPDGALRAAVSGARGADVGGGAGRTGAGRVRNTEGNAPFDYCLLLFRNVCLWFVDVCPEPVLANADPVFPSRN